MAERIRSTDCAPDEGINKICNECISEVCLTVLATIRRPAVVRVPMAKESVLVNLPSFHTPMITGEEASWNELEGQVVNPAKRTRNSAFNVVSFACANTELYRAKAKTSVAILGRVRATSQYPTRTPK